VLIEPDLSVPGHRELFVIGDMSALTDANGTRVPGLAAAAIQQGTVAAQNILRDLRGEQRVPFRYRDRGSMATIGLHRAVAEFGHKKFSGLTATRQLSSLKRKQTRLARPQAGRPDRWK